MALRSLGSSLVARGGVGSRTREMTEAQISQPSLPEKGQVGTLSRGLIQDPLERPVPAGSEKMIAQQPLVESGVTAPTEPNTPIGAPEGALTPNIGVDAARSAPQVPSGAQNQPLFQGGVSPARAAAPAAQVRQGTPARVTGSTGGVAEVAQAYRPTPVAGPESQSQESRSQGQQSPQFERESLVGATIGNVLGSKAYAADPKAPIPYTPTAGQYIQGGAGKVLGAVANVTNNAALRSLSNQMQSAGGQPTKNASGQKINTAGSVSAALRSLTQNASNAVQKAVQTVSNALRSLNPFAKK